MSSTGLNIGILELSDIIYEGLSSTLHKLKFDFKKLIRINNLEEIEEGLISKYDLKIIIINPSYLQNNIKEFKKLRKGFQEIYWIGLVYNYFDKDIISMLNETILITSSTEEIFKTFNKIINHINKNSNKINDKIEDQLSDREIDVLIQLVNGLSNKEIAEKLNISIHTVVSHRKNITIKTGIKSQSGLTIYAITKNIISLYDISDL